MDKIMRQLLLLSLIYMCYGYLKQGNQCDSQTGTCLSDVQCNPGWMGSGCQQNRPTYEFPTSMKLRLKVQQINRLLAVYPIWSHSYGCNKRTVNIAYNVSVRSYHCDQGLNVVDGRESTCATFTSQSGDPAFLVLDLGRKVNILEVDLVNPNASGDSLQKFGISLSQDNVTFKTYYWYQRTGFPVITETSLKSDIIARFVRIEPNGTEHISTLCEIEITGECENFYGNCSTPCGHCASGEQCNKVTGQCDVSRCADGWQTVKCDKTCNDSYYGDCMTKCGHCRQSAICDKINGSCPLGLCSQGWHGERCDKACNDSYYGDCMTKCGHCIHSTICDKINGSCPSGLCSEGWHGERCDKDISALKEALNVGIIAGTVSAVVGVIIVFVISVVIVKTRRRRETTEKEKDTSSQKVNNIEHDISKAYYNTEDSRTQRSDPIHTTQINGVKTQLDVSLHSGYEKLRDRMGTEELAYSVIDHGLTDNNGRSSLENTFYN